MATIYLEMQRLRVRESGLGQVCLHLGRALSQLAPPELSLGAYLPAREQGCFGSGWEYREVERWHRWLGVPRAECRVWHCLHQDSRYWPRDRRTPVVLTIHDLNFLARPGGSTVRRRLARLQKSLDRAAAVTVISSATGQAVRQHLRVPDVPFRVIYNGNCLAPEAPEERPEFAPPGPFLFSVSHLHPRKNQAVLLPLLARRPDLWLVLAGQDDHPYAARLRREAAELGVSSRLVMPGVIGDAAKVWLMRHCRAFVFPSLTEGFGLPVVEAMSAGVPVFLSRCASLPEVGGDAAFYWESFAPEAMADVVERGLARFDAGPEWAGRLRARARTFSWEEAARQYLTLYRELAGAGREPACGTRTHV